MNENAKIISLIRKKEALWNFSSRDYKDIEKVNQLWMEVANELKITKDQVKTKWRLLRTAYLRESEGVKKGTPSQWPLFPEMAFLENNIYENTTKNPIITDRSINESNLQLKKQNQITESLDITKDSNRLYLMSLHKYISDLPLKNKISMRTKIMQFIEKNV